ncbi:DUF2330 domain-containing protein [Sorangium cellulosum]|uniref:DUF2330 domain-containing protein n=1 Tax=Sorangium cellulosum TaxID=56 RepID=UPI00040577E3|nr:DUF2330 domain-containing protein [Sorangium cellulosum]
MKLRLLALLALAVPSATLLSPREALACGGCFAPPTETTVVNAHRMVLSVSPVQSVLWDQIQYSGDPREFAWVLPVKPGATIEVGSDAWFETLDAATSVRITAPNSFCASSGGGCGTLASADSEGGVAGAFGNDQVTVLHRGTVGPYETVTLTTDTPGALNTWLERNGFGVDESTQPVIDAYVEEQFDFIALKLQPGKDVKEMKPVRVVMPGANATLPLRMVAAGTGANVAITLFTISEARLAPEGFAAAAVPVDLLAWDFASQDSNYGELREKALAAHDGGRAFLTPYAQQGSLFSPVSSSAAPFGVQYTTSGSTTPVDTIAAAFAQQGLANRETQDTECAVRFAEIATETRAVASPCPAGVPLSDPSCGEVAAGQIDARELACGPLDDLAVAMIGLHPRDVWLTRLEANLPRAALDTDLVLSPAKQERVDNWMRARLSVHAEVLCGAALPLVDGDRAARTRGQGTLVGMTLGALALAAAIARRGARRFASRPA